MKTLTTLALVIAASVTLTGLAQACAPAPSCWMNEKQPGYLKSICAGYAKDKKTQTQIAEFMEEPELVPAFAAACKKLGVTLNK